MIHWEKPDIEIVWQPEPLTLNPFIARSMKELWMHSSGRLICVVRHRGGPYCVINADEVTGVRSGPIYWGRDGYPVLETFKNREAAIMCARMMNGGS